MQVSLAIKKISKQTFEIDKFKLQVDKRCM